jgi:hypothetical protein
MTSCDVITGQLLYDEGGAKPRGVVVFKLWLHSVETSVSTLSPIQDCLPLLPCESPLRLVEMLSTCAEQVTLTLTLSHSPLEP